MQTRTVTTVLDVRRDDVFAYLSQVENLSAGRPSSPASSGARAGRPKSSTASVSSSSRSKRTGTPA